MPRGKFKEILERQKTSIGAMTSKVKKMGGTAATQVERPRGTPTPGVRKSMGWSQKPSREDQPKPREKFRNLSAVGGAAREIKAQRGETLEGRQAGFKARERGAPREQPMKPVGGGGKIQDDPSFRKLDRSAQREIEKSGNPRAALAEATGQRQLPGGGYASEEEFNERMSMARAGPGGEKEGPEGVGGAGAEHRGAEQQSALGKPGAPQPEGTPQDQAETPAQPVTGLPPKEEDMGRLEAQDARASAISANPEFDELPPDKQRLELGESMVRRDINAAVDEVTEPPTEPMRLAMNRIPQSHEMKSLTKGSIVQTPYGDVSKDARTGRISITASPLMKEKIRQREKVELKQFGTYPGMTDPDSPKPPITAGQRSYNPFTNTWVNNEKSVLKKYMKRGE